MDNFETLKAQHDELLLNKPEDEVHDESVCVLCNPDLIKDNSQERGESMDTYTQEQLDAAVEAAQAPLLAKLKGLEDTAVASQIDSALADLRTELEGKLTDLQSQLDAAELRASTAEKTLEDSLTWIEAVVAAEAEVAQIEVRKVERAEILKTETAFSEDYIAKRIDDLAKLSDEAFDEKLSEWKELSPVANETASLDAGSTVVKTVRKEGAAKTSFFDSFRKLNAETAEAGLPHLRPNL